MRGAACVQIRQLVEDNFLIWGPIKRLYMVHLKTLAFVEYEWRSSAEFAKEAMCKQGLKGSTQVRRRCASRGDSSRGPRR